MGIKTLALLFGPVAAFATGFAMLAAGAVPAAAVTLGVTVLCVIWWVLEPIPIPATSLVPLAVLPMSGVLTGAEVGQAYGHPVVLLLLGGFILSTAMERSGAHRRIALALLHRVGSGSSRRVVFGFMIAAAALSMWISNTATTLMLLPVALAVLERARDPKLAPALLLGIAYAANIGGVGTPVGTPPNMIFRGVYEETFGATIGFGEWMALGLPVVLIFLPLMGLWLTRTVTYKGALELPESGAWRPEEKRVLTVFGLTALAWITRVEPMGGWMALFDLPYTNDAMVAFLAVVAMFIVPNGKGRAAARLGNGGEDTLGHAHPVRGRARHRGGVQVFGAVGIHRQWGVDDLRLAGVCRHPGHLPGGYVPDGSHQQHGDHVAAHADPGGGRDRGGH